VHISNIFKRDDWRAKSVISPAAEGVISGFGLDVYIMALNFILKKQ
jgi:3-dehydroquinate dehydratase-2